MVATTKHERLAQSDFMDLAEFADRYGIGRTAVYELAKAGKLPVPIVRAGREYRISREAYRRFHEGQNPTGIV